MLSDYYPRDFLTSQAHKRIRELCMLSYLGSRYSVESFEVPASLTRWLCEVPNGAPGWGKTEGMVTLMNLFKTKKKEYFSLTKALLIDDMDGLKELPREQLIVLFDAERSGSTSVAKQLVSARRAGSTLRVESRQRLCVTRALQSLKKLVRCEFCMV